MIRLTSLGDHPSSQPSRPGQSVTCLHLLRSPHAVDQGAICRNEDQPSQIALPSSECARLVGASNEFGQPVVFHCVQYYTTACSFDVSNQGGAGGGSFMEAMRAFAMCADANVEVPGYCHGAIADAKVLANQAVCQAGVNTNIGFRESAVLLRPLRVPAVTPLPRA